MNLNLGRLFATGFLSVLVSCALGLAWIHSHPVPRLVRVDVGSLFEEQKKTLVARLKPGMTEDEQKAIFKVAADYGKQIDVALSTLANECKCAVLNSVALVRTPESSETGIADATDRVRQLLTQK